MYCDGVAQCQDGGLCRKRKVSLIIFQSVKIGRKFGRMALRRYPEAGPF